MSARGIPAWRRSGTIGSRFDWLAPGLEHLALGALIITIFLLGYWISLPVGWFSASWTIGSQYQLVTLFDSPFQTIILYPSDIAAVVTIVLWLLGHVAASVTHTEHDPLRLGPLYLTLPLIGLAALSALSATQAILPILSLEIALHLFLVALLVIAVINLRPPRWAVVAPLALLLTIEGLLSLAQVLAQSTLLSHLLFNVDQNSTPNQPETSVVQLPNGTRWLRAYGSFPHPNILGGFLCLAIPIVAGAYMWLPRRRSAWLLLVSLALGMLALLLSFSRAAWLGVFISALWAGLFFWQKRRTNRPANKFAAKGLQPRSWRSPLPSPHKANGIPHQPAERVSWRNTRSGDFNRRRWGRPAQAVTTTILCLLGIGILVGLVAALGPVIQTRLLLTNSALEQRSVSERVLLLEAGAVLFTQHPWLGVGAGNMPLVELSYPPTHNIGEPTHNVPIAVAVETGLFGLLLWLIPPIGVLWTAWRRRFSLSSAGLAASAALLALLTVAQLDHYLWTQPTASLIWWLTVALAALWSADNNATTSIAP